MAKYAHVGDRRIARGRPCHGRCVRIGKASDADSALNAAIVASPQTRIDLGIAVARAELASGRHNPAALPTMMVLTDGHSNPVGPEVAVLDGFWGGGRCEGKVVFRCSRKGCPH